jgi:hypothetical protein
MVSEDSDHLSPGLLAIHRLDDFRKIHQTLTGQVQSSIDQTNAARELLEVTLLRRMQRIRLEERNDRLDQVRPASYSVAIQVLPVVVVPLVSKHASHSEEPYELMKTRDALCALRHRKLVGHLIAGFVASAPRSMWLPNETYGEATLSVYKTNNPAELDQSFLLISCTRHIVTVPPTCDGTRSAGYSGVPAYGQMRTVRLPVRGAAILP